MAYFEFVYEHKTDDNEIKELNVIAEVKYYIENDYGADADGNKGVKKAFIDEIILHSIKYDGFEICPDQEITDRIKDYAEEKFYEK